MSLFAEESREAIHFNLPDAELIYFPYFFSPEKADELYQVLLKDTIWQQDPITLFGKTHLQPRLTALYGNDGRPYSYSNIVMQPHAWTPALTYIREEIETVCPEAFTTVLLNQYRDGKDSNGWHADNERELGRNPVIASVSLGAERQFQLRHNEKKEYTQKINLRHGSLLIMGGATQQYWKHQIPKTAKPTGSRINLTFRKLK